MNHKEEIVRLRNNGLGYKKIAQQLNLNINSVKSFCRNHQLTSKNLQSIYCKNCKQLLVQKDKHKKRIFCCDACRRNWWNQHRHESRSKNKVEVLCKYCGKEFQAYVHEKRKYCSHQCYIESRFRGELI